MPRSRLSPTGTVFLSYASGYETMPRVDTMWRLKRSASSSAAPKVDVKNVAAEGRMTRALSALRRLLPWELQPPLLEQQRITLLKTVGRLERDERELRYTLEQLRREIVVIAEEYE